MDRRAFIRAVVLITLGAPLAADAQPPGKVYRIGYLGTGSRSAPTHPVDAFVRALRELGYVEGQNLVIEYRFLEGHGSFSALAADLVRLKVDLIVAESPPASRAAKQATAAIPIVMAAGGDPVGTGLVASLARPGGNVTGLAHLAPELGGKRLELLKEAVPRLARVAALWNPTNPSAAHAFKKIEAAAQSLRVQLQSLEARTLDDIERAFSALKRDRVGAFIVLPDPMLHSHRSRIVELAAKNRVPAMYYVGDWVEAGGLMSYGASFPDLYRHAAGYVDKILKGAKPADLPLQRPTKFELVINMKTAKALGLTIPPALLFRADRIID